MCCAVNDGNRFRVDNILCYGGQGIYFPVSIKMFIMQMPLYLKLYPKHVILHSLRPICHDEHLTGTCMSDFCTSPSSGVWRIGDKCDGLTARLSEQARITDQTPSLITGSSWSVSSNSVPEYSHGHYGSPVWPCCQGEWRMTSVARWPMQHNPIFTPPWDVLSLHAYRLSTPIPTKGLP